MQSSISDLTTEIRSTRGSVPPPLVGASMTIVGNAMYVFGGRLVASRQMTNHLYILDLTTLVWERHIGPPGSAPPPPSRYFHSTNVYRDSFLVVFGGMGHAFSASHKNATYEQGDLCALDDICVFDLASLSWQYPHISPSLYTPQARYAHLAECIDDKFLVIGGQDMANQYINEINVFDLKVGEWVQGESVDQHYGAYRTVAFCPRRPLGSHRDDDDRTLCIYSNYNFTNVTRHLLSCCPLHDRPVTFTDHSNAMSGTVLPPGLRFPSSHVLGNHLILTGTFLTPTHYAFHIWAMNLATLAWMRIDTGSSSSGSWNRSVLDSRKQKLYVVGNQSRDLLEDYNHRQINFDHVAIVDLEAFGIYTPPLCVPTAQELGLSMLNEPGLADMHILSTDRHSIPVNSAILAQRWSYFAKRIMPDLQQEQPRRILQFTEPYPVTLAFLQYLYTDHLFTAQQHQPGILARLLILAHMFNMPRLIQLSTHALHQLLTVTTASLVYETAALTCRTALQIRALRVMINARKMIQQVASKPALPLDLMVQQQQQQQQQSSMVLRF